MFGEDLLPQKFFALCVMLLIAQVKPNFSPQMVLFWQYLSALSCPAVQAYTPPKEYCQQTNLIIPWWLVAY